MKKQTNLLNPTPAQIRRRNRLWVNALLENKRKARGAMYDKRGGRCCLAVAQDVAISHGVDANSATSTLPARNVCEFFGWRTVDPELHFEIGGNSFVAFASSLNDGSYEFKTKKRRNTGYSHKEIAQIVMQNLVNL